MDIISEIRDKNIFHGCFKDLSTWWAWEVYLKALFNLPITGPKELDLFRQCTGLPEPPKDRVRESYADVGRGAGKSYINAIDACHHGIQNWTPYLSPGEKAWIFVIAPDRAQAKIIKDYISGIMNSTSGLRAMIARDGKDEIELKNRVTISVKTCSYRTIRGYTVVMAILDELAFFRDENSANPDREILAALRPALARVPGSLLIGISTPYSRSGVLFDQYQKGFGKPGGPLFWKAPSIVMNPTIDQEFIQRAMDDDPVAGRSEWLAEWRDDISSFVTLPQVEACVVVGQIEVPPVLGGAYYGFLDASSGRSDSFTAAVAHRAGDKFILDAIRETKPPFRPEDVIQQYAGLFRRYECLKVQADRYAVGFVSDLAAKYGLLLENCPSPASDIYLGLLPMILNQSVELLDDKTLILQLTGLERRVRVGGRDLVTHFPGSHDDVVNAAAGALVLAAGSLNEDDFKIRWI